MGEKGKDYQPPTPDEIQKMEETAEGMMSSAQKFLSRDAEIKYPLRQQHNELHPRESRGGVKAKLNGHDVWVSHDGEAAVIDGIELGFANAEQDNEVKELASRLHQKIMDEVVRTNYGFETDAKLEEIARFEVQQDAELYRQKQQREQAKDVIRELLGDKSKSREG